MCLSRQYPVILDIKEKLRQYSLFQDLKEVFPLLTLYIMDIEENFSDNKLLC